MSGWRVSRNVLELTQKGAAVALRFGARGVEESRRKHCFVEELVLDLIARIGDHAQCGDQIAYDIVVGQSVALCETARNSRIQKRRFEDTADLVLAVENADVAPLEPAVVLGSIPAQILEQPVRLSFFVGKGDCGYRKRRVAGGALWGAVVEQRRVQRDELARGIEHTAWTTVVVLELDHGGGSEIITESLEHARVRARP